MRHPGGGWSVLRAVIDGKRFAPAGAAPERHVLGRVALDLRAGEVVAVTGPSGCGKTTLLNLVAGLVQQGPGWRFNQYVRLDNVADKDYVGSVIVNEGNGRFYEPSPRRSMSAGVQASLQF